MVAINMVIGRYDGKVNAKKQVAIPKEFREILGDRVIITKGLSDHLIIVSEESWQTLLEGTEGKPFTNQRAAETQRYILGNATVVDLDSQGRFVIPEYLRKHADIGDEVVFAGIQRFVEVWNKNKWEEQQQYLEKNIRSIADRLTERED